MIIIEGPRNVGKTYLSGFLPDVFKFPTLNYLEGFKFNPRESWSFSCAKDLMLNSLQDLLPSNLVVDRSFLSTVVYSRLLNRCSNEEAINFLEMIKLNNVKIVFITGINPVFSREKDSLDYLKYTDQINLYKEYIDLFPHIKFTNHFNQKSVYDFQDLIKEL